jgi:hypothetical protein
LPGVSSTTGGGLGLRRLRAYCKEWDESPTGLAGPAPA